MFFSETDLSDFIEENDVKFIRMTFCDTFGNMKNITITAPCHYRRHSVQCHRTAGGIAPEPAAETGHLYPVHSAVAAPVRSCSTFLL